MWNIHSSKPSRKKQCKNVKESISVAESDSEEEDNEDEDNGAAARQAMVDSDGVISSAKDIPLVFTKNTHNSQKGCWCEICRELKVLNCDAWFTGAARKKDNPAPEVTLEQFGFNPEEQHPPFTKDNLLDHVIKLFTLSYVASVNTIYKWAFEFIKKKPFHALIKFLRPAMKESKIPTTPSSSTCVPSKISFTFNPWTSEAFDPYLAISVHYIYSLPDDPTKWTLEGNIIGFSPVIDCFDIRKKIGWFTSNNATINDRTMKCLTEPGMACEDIFNWDPTD
ncbi:hypothetical protein M422DRAFT_276627 [Sphaerobolus stellatus SS14]|uniref:Uncharacterized protein n=1 Tax=Sphaerobolus stellatus (strain SS14) TaxID=990650 RepID=A0A0C9UBN2_SPHS4|nr:hypothetical protein M422DRAFT_276627 [Sphaerobolus stellatus SS14]